MDTSLRLSVDTVALEDEEVRKKIKDIIDEINLSIIAHDKHIKQKTIEQILSNEDWIKELEKYTGSLAYEMSIDVSVFSRADSEKWIHAIMNASIEDINLFCCWLKEYFPSDVIKESAKVDLPVIEKILDGMNIDIEKDLIKKRNLLWLKNQLADIIELYKGHSGHSIC